MVINQSKCKYCDEIVYFVKPYPESKVWNCVNDTRHFLDHPRTCYKKKNYIPRFKVSDIVSVEWPTHLTIYKIKEIDSVNKLYRVQFIRQENTQFVDRSDPIPIIKLDTMGCRDESGIGEAIFG